MGRVGSAAVFPLLPLGSSCNPCSLSLIRIRILVPGPRPAIPAPRPCPRDPDSTPTVHVRYIITRRPPPLPSRPFPLSHVVFLPVVPGSPRARPVIVNVCVCQMSIRNHNSNRKLSVSFSHSNQLVLVIPVDGCSYALQNQSLSHRMHAWGVLWSFLSTLATVSRCGLAAAPQAGRYEARRAAHRPMEACHSCQWFLRASEHPSIRADSPLSRGRVRNRQPCTREPNIRIPRPSLSDSVSGAVGCRGRWSRPLD